ncbi:flagellar assembly protein FliW, partial [Acinetobacter baumannii]
MTTTMTPTQEITTTRFGVVPYTDEDVITFEDGLVGFPTFSRYVVICPREDSPFRWLQSLEEPALAFLVAEP